MSDNKRSLFSKMDFVGTRIGFYLNGSDNVQTNFGGFLSILIALCLALMVAAFGQDFFNRTNPSFITKMVNPADYPMFTLTNKNFSFAYYIEDLDGIPFYDSTQFYHEFLYLGYKKNAEQIWETTYNEPMKVSRCTKDHFSDQEKFEKKKLAAWFCPELDNVKVGGYWDSDALTYFRIKVHRCWEGRKNPYTGEDCAPDEKSTKSLASRLFVSTMSQVYLVNPSDYENPLELDYSTKYQMLDSNMLRRAIMFFKEAYLLTDYGWMLETFRTHTALGLNYIEFDSIHLSDLQVGNEKPSMYYEISIYFDKKQDNFFRRYTKLQDLAAQVGGIIKMIFTGGAIIVFFYNSSYLQYTLINSNFYDTQSTPIYINLENSKKGGIIGTIVDTDKQKNSTIIKESYNQLKGNKDLELKITKLKKKFIKKTIKQKSSSKALISSFCSYFTKLRFLLLCPGCQNKKDKKKLLMIQSANDHIKKYLDVNSVIKAQITIEKMLKLLFTDDQRFMLGYMKTDALNTNGVNVASTSTEMNYESERVKIDDFFKKCMKDQNEVELKILENI